MGKHSSRRKSTSRNSSKSKCQREDDTKQVFTFHQMERVVDLIDRQARLIAGERFLPVDAYVYAKNYHFDYTGLNYDSISNTYYFTLYALEPAILNYLYHKKYKYTDGTIGFYKTFTGADRYRIYLDQTQYAEYNPNTLMMTFYNIPNSTVTDMYNLGYIESEVGQFFTENPVDYHRDEAVEPPPTASFEFN